MITKTRREFAPEDGAMKLSTHKLFSALVLVMLFGLTARPILVPDFWWHLRTGQHMVETGSIPRSIIRIPANASIRLEVPI